MLNTGTIQITPSFLNFIAGIDEFKGTWRALGTLAPERLTAPRRVATIESIGSSTRIEGSGLSDRDVEHLLANLEIRPLATRDEQEVAGYAGVMRVVFDSRSASSRRTSASITGRCAQPRHNPERVAGLATLAGLLPPVGPPADAAAQREGGARTPADGVPAGASGAHP